MLAAVRRTLSLWALSRSVAMVAALHMGSFQELSAGAEGEASLLRWKAALLQSKARARKFNCSEFPAFCQEPFNCHKEPAPKDRTPNLNLWCQAYPLYSQPAVECAAGNLSGYASLLPATQKGLEKKSPANITNIDAAYCWLAGHCDHPHPTPDGTSLQEMEQMCDERYGAEHWRHKFKPGISVMSSVLGGALSGKMHGDLFHPKQVTIHRGFADTMAELACVMGNYHCDVQYCKQIYCNDPFWAKKHSHLGKQARPHTQKAETTTKGK